MIVTGRAHSRMFCHFNERIVNMTQPAKKQPGIRRSHYAAQYVFFVPSIFCFACCLFFSSLLKLWTSLTSSVLLYVATNMLSLFCWTIVCFFLNIYCPSKLKKKVRSTNCFRLWMLYAIGALESMIKWKKEGKGDENRRLTCRANGYVKRNKSRNNIVTIVRKPLSAMNPTLRKEEKW